MGQGMLVPIHPVDANSGEFRRDLKCGYQEWLRKMLAAVALIRPSGTFSRSEKRNLVSAQRLPRRSVLVAQIVGDGPVGHLAGVHVQAVEQVLVVQHGLPGALVGQL